MESLPAKLTAAELAADARANIEILCMHPNFPSRSQAFQAIVENGGPTLTMIQDFQAGRRDNPRIKTLDKLRAGIRQTMLDLVT